MATAVVKSAPQPGDGTWLTRRRKAGRDRRRRRSSITDPTSSPADRSGVQSPNARDSKRGRSKGPARKPYRGKEPTSLHSHFAPDSSSADLRTIAEQRPLSHHPRGLKGFRDQPASPSPPYQFGSFEQQSSQRLLNHTSARKPNTTMASAGARAVPPHLRGKSIPPHLRRQQHQPEAKSTANAKTPAKVSAPVVGERTPTKHQSPATPPLPGRSPSHNASVAAAQEALKAEHAARLARERLPPHDSTSIITQKLPSLGAKVSEPVAVSKAFLVAYPSSEEGEEASVGHVSASKPVQKSGATAAASPTVETAFTNAATTGTATANEPPQRSRKNSSPRGSHAGMRLQRGGMSWRGRGRGGRAPRDTNWPKNSEIPKGDPERWEIKWDDKHDRGSICSARADSGFGDSKKKPTVPPGIDPDTGFLLTDFSGNWAPAPIDWDARPAFRPHQSAGTIEKWRQRIEEDMVGKTWAVPQGDLVAADGMTYYFAPSPHEKDLLIQGEIAPRYWSSVVVGHESPSTFWRKLVASDEPGPLDVEDLIGARPWWETYEAAHSCALRPYDHPDVKGISPSETEHERLRRENDNGSLHHAENRKRAEIAKRDAERERRKRAQEKARKLSASTRLGPPREIKTGLDIFLRSAIPEDMPRIKEIYNHYVEHTVCVPETERRKDADMLRRYQDVLEKKLPFIVACERGGLVKARKNKHEPIVLPDKLVGFAYADDHHDMKGMYRFTCDMEVYTDSAHYMKGVAKCLCDKLLGLLDPEYVERGGYAIEGAELEGDGASRVISNIVVTVPYENAERLEWKSRFLTQFLGFKQVCVMEGMGNKLGQSVSVATFQRKTGVEFDPASPPIMSEYTR